MKKMNKTSLATVIGAAVVSSFATNVNAESNPFVMNELSSGYMQLAVADTAATPIPAKTTTPAVAKPATKTAGTCAEGKCGEMMKDKAMAAAMAMPVKTEEGKCGQGSCGAMMQNGKMKAGMEMSCGAMMKGKEGSCGDMVAPAAAAHPPVAAKKAAPVKPAAAPAKPAEKKVVEGTCAKPVEETHTTTKHHEEAAKANAPWGNRKKIVNP